MVKISIIIPVYNGVNYIKKSYKSILKQNIEDIEVIYVDDGSSDGSLSKLKHLQKISNFVRVFSQNNSGPANARNIGLREAKGEYIAFLDVDDIYLDENALDSMYNYAKEYNANIVCANLKRISQDGLIIDDDSHKNQRYAYFTKKDVIKPEEYGIPWAFYKNIYKKSFLDENNIIFPNLNIGEDPLFLANVLIKTNVVHVLNKDLYGYNYSIGGGFNLKLNTYDKKRDNIQHYVEMFNLLEENNFSGVLSEYKLEFLDYLTFRDNLLDEDIQNIIKYFFKSDYHFTPNDYGYNIINLLKNPVEYDDYLESVALADNCIYKEVLIENHHIDSYRLRKYVQMEKQVNKADLEKISTIQLKNTDIQTFNELRDKLHLVGKFKKEIKRLIRYNDEILTSRSWNVTKFLRSLKHQYK